MLINLVEMRADRAKEHFSLYVRVQRIDVLIFNGMLHVSHFYFAVSSVFVSNIMDRSLSFHKNLKCSMFVWANSQTFKGPYRFHYCIFTTALHACLHELGLMQTFSMFMYRKRHHSDL